MNKRFSQFVFAAVMAFAMILPICSTSAFAQSDGSTGTGTGYGASARWRSFNRQATVFSNLAGQASSTIGGSRYLRLLSAYLGVPVQVINNQWSISGMSLDQFTIAAIVSDLSGVPLETIMADMNSGISLTQLISNINANGSNITINLIVLSLKDFQAIITDAINANANAGANVDLGVFIFDLNRFMVNFEARFNRYATILGNDVFREVLFQRLSEETGVPVAELMRQWNLSQMYIPQLSQFSSMFLLRGILIATDGPFDRVDFNIPMTPAMMAELLFSGNIPVELFLRRASAFQRQLALIGSPRSRGNGEVFPVDSTSGE